MGQIASAPSNEALIGRIFEGTKYKVAYELNMGDYLLCHANFFPHFYPELKGVVGPHMFGYNKRTHLIHFAIYLPASAAAAALCTLLCT